jgi:predicted glutamine amidotransferase
MCRLLGIVASEPTEFAVVLTNAPRCLATLSREHPDGWGIAVHADEWRVHRGTDRAYDDRRFFDVAAGSRGHILVAHVRQKTVGPTRIENTHPFSSDGWIFAHNGTVKRTDVLRAGASKARLAAVAGDTDSELLFAHLLTRLDDAGLLEPRDERARAAATALLEAVTSELRAKEIGAFNFLLSDGETCFAHRMGRSLFVLERGPAAAARPDRSSMPPKWTPRRRAVLVASERITDEPWREVPEGTLLRVDRRPAPTVAHGADAIASVEDARGKVA